jgi:hypothetical protein
MAKSTRISSTGGRPDSVPWSDRRPFVEFRNVDPNCPFVRYEESVKADLFEHLGGFDSATAPERLIIVQAAKMAAVSRLLGERLIDTGSITVENTAMFGTWSNNLLRYLSAIGIKKPAVQAATLDQYLAKRTRTQRKRALRIKPVAAIPLQPIIHTDIPRHV